MDETRETTNELRAEVRVLDHGYVRLVEAWGSDERIIEAARMSTDGGFRGWGPIHDSTCRSIVPPYEDPITGEIGRFYCDCTPQSGDEKLLSYLYRNQHNTPFEMAGAIFEIQAPIFVFREWHRHRTQSYNELSSRYTPIPDVNYIPSLERLLVDTGSNKQATSTGARLTEPDARSFQNTLRMSYSMLEARYQQALADGVPKELARVLLPVGRYSKMRAGAVLRNWLAFLTLRCDPRAQYEIRMYAGAVATLLVSAFPRTLELWGKYETKLVERDVPLIATVEVSS